MIYLLEIEGHHYRFPFWIRFIEIDELRDLKYKQPIFPGSIYGF